MPPQESADWTTVLLSPAVLVTLLICIALGGLIFWIMSAWQHRQRAHALAEQRNHQETTVQRLIQAMDDDKEALVADYEQRLRERDARIATLEGEVSRLRDRLTSSGILGLFGGGQREVVSALLLENEQLHEIIAQKQEQLRDLMTDMTGKLMERLDEQAQESAKAVRYKQALLSAFLQREDARRLFEGFLAERKDAPPELPKPPES